MRDPAFIALLPALQQSAGTTLWVADENALDAVQRVCARPDLLLLANRYDVASAGRQAGHVAQFSDLDFSVFPARSFQRIIYRLSKEKPVVHHVLNHALHLLAEGGELLLSGLKNDGAKTFIDKCRIHFGNGGAQKVGNAYCGRFVRSPGLPDSPWLDDQDYAALRLIHTPGFDFYSKPGVFGWNKVDGGSALLLQYLPEVLRQYACPPQSLLDLGCGYGYLTCQTRHLSCLRRVATDNNAAALRAMAANAAYYGMAVDVQADDAGASLAGQFDLVLCNPPFHQGFAVDADLTDRFLRNTRRLLAPAGRALFVVNGFIPLEHKAAACFSHVSTLASNGSFKVVMLTG